MPNAKLRGKVPQEEKATSSQIDRQQSTASAGLHLPFSRLPFQVSSATVAAELGEAAAGD